MCKIGLRGWERAGEVGEGAPLASIEVGLDLVNEDVAAPAVLNRLAGVPNTLLRIGELVEQDAIVEPGDLCSKLLHKSLVGPGAGKGTHVLQVAARKAFEFRKSVLKVTSEAIDNLGAPAGLTLPGKDIAADLPVEDDQFAISC